MSHVDRNQKVYRKPSAVFPPGEGSGPEPTAINDAAAALREVEVDAIDPELAPDSKLKAGNCREIESLNIDELRALAKELDVPDRETITESEELVAAIRRSLYGSIQ